MKNYILSIIAMAFCMQNAFAQTISVDDVTIKAGETKVVSINLNNPQKNIVSFQMDLTLPEGITINKAECALGSRIKAAEQELTIGKQLDGSIRMISTSFSLTPIIGTSGEIVKLSLTAACDAKGGTASLKNVVLATNNSQELIPADVSFNVNVPYTLTYKVDGGEYRTITVSCGIALIPLPAPTKEGYSFSGWNNLPTTMPNHDVEVTGGFTINSYTIIYKVDGEIYKTSTVVYGTELKPETEPNKKGYTFSGWSKIPETMPSHDVEVSGSFDINKYKLTYEVNGKVYKEYIVEYNSEITPEDFPKEEGYTFSGWSWIPKEMPAEDVVVTGTFTINSYTITYVLDGEVYTTDTLEYGAEIVPPVIPGLEEYTIWEDVPETMPASDITVYGKAKEIIDGIGPIQNSKFKTARRRMTFQEEE